MFVLNVYRHGSLDPDVCTFENRREYLEAERTLRKLVRRAARSRTMRREYGAPVLVETADHIPLSCA